MRATKQTTEGQTRDLHYNTCTHVYKLHKWQVAYCLIHEHSRIWDHVVREIFESLTKMTLPVVSVRVFRSQLQSKVCTLPRVKT